MHPVIDLIRARAEAGSQPGRRSDPYRLALSIEGGGMRGVVSAGMVSGIEYLGLLRVFDAVYGTSAGAVNGAYLVAGQATYGTTIYYQNINNSRFISFARLFGKRPAMSLAFLLDDVAVRQKILDCDAVIQSTVPLNVIVSSVQSCRSEVIRNFTSPAQVREALRASARVPLFAGPPVNISGTLYLDGMLFESIPYQTPVADGFTHILALLTRPIGYRISRPSFLIKTMTKRYLTKLNPSLATAFDARLEEYPKSIEQLLSQSSTPSRPPYVYALTTPPCSKQVSRFSRDRGELIRGAKAGMSAIFDTFGPAGMQLVEILAPFSSDTGHSWCSHEL